MKVFVTGGAGYIGSVCTEELLNAGHHVTVYRIAPLTEASWEKLQAHPQFAK